MKLLRKRGVWVVLATMACIAGAWLVGSQGTTQYASTAVVDVEARVFANTVPVTPNLANELAIACTMPAPAAAQRCAAAVAQAYANFRNDAASSKSVRSHDSFSVTIVTPAPLPSTPTGTSKLVVLSLRRRKRLR